MPPPFDYNTPRNPRNPNNAGFIPQLPFPQTEDFSILLTLLHLGIRNIRLGPTLPAFLSKNVLSYLVEQYGIAPITTPKADLEALMG